MNSITCPNCGKEAFDKGDRLVCRHCGMWGRSNLQ